MNKAAARLSLEELIGELAEEFSERIRSGETPSVEEYVGRYPQAAAEIRRIFPALEMMVEPPALAGAPDKKRADPFPAPQNGVLGDYRLIREVGRGGMGVVYEAVQISLGRRVALKILPFAAVLDQRQILRFKNEALAAAQLDHAHIVDVFGVGCERSVHFYAMRFVEGETLAAVIAELQPQDSAIARELSHQALAMLSGDSDSADNVDRGAATVLQNRDSSTPKDILPPNPIADFTATETKPIAKLTTQHSTHKREFFRSTARIGVEIATALNHAHEHGVIHRDVKPSNLLIDKAGKCWITDFGLARMGDANLTMTGDLLGTLRYMSPEQALAKRVVIDHRTDIYSLGVTLYELLVQRPAFPENDRQELLRRISFEEPVRPSKLNPHVPPDLETIVLKASSKNPDERYATAEEMAEDLERFLVDKPIHARRPTIRQRLKKWARRHQGFVAAATVVMAVAVIALTISTWLLTQKQSLLTTQQIELVSERNAASNNANEAEENFELALEAVDEMLRKVGDKDLIDLPHVSNVRREILDRAVDFYERLIKKRGDNPEVARAAAGAYVSIANVYIRIDDFVKAEQSIKRAKSLLAPLLTAQANHGTSLLGMARAHRTHGRLLQRISKLPETETEFRSALECIRRVNVDEQKTAKFQHALGRSQMLLGGLLAERGRLQEALREYRAAEGVAKRVANQRQNISNVEFQLELMAVRGRLTSLLDDLNRYDEALRMNRMLVDDLRALVRNFDEHPRCRAYLAGSLVNLGHKLWKRENLDLAAMEAFHEALSLNEKLAEEFPFVAEYRNSKLTVLANLGAVAAKSKRTQESEKYLNRAITIARKQAAQFPRVADYQHVLGGTYNNIGVIKAQNPVTRVEAISFYRKAVEYHGIALALKPHDNDFREALAHSTQNVAMMLGCSGKQKDALAAILALQKALGDNWDSHSKVQQCLIKCIRCLNKEKRLPQPMRSVHERNYLVEAGRYLDNAVRLTLEESAQQQAHKYRLSVVYALNKLALKLAESKHFEEAERCCRIAIRRLETQYAENRRAGDVRFELAKSLNHLVNILSEAGKLDAVEQAAERAIPFMEELLNDAPGKPGHHVVLGGTLDGYAAALVASNQPEQAVELLKRAIKLQNTALKIRAEYRQSREFLQTHHIRLIEVFGSLAKHDEAFHQARKFKSAFVLPWRATLNAANVLRQSLAKLKSGSALEARYDAEIKKHLDKISSQVPTTDSQLSQLARDLDVLGRRLVEQRLNGSASVAFLRSLEVRKIMHDAAPDDATLRTELAVGHHNLGRFLFGFSGNKEAWHDAARHVRESIRIRKELLPSSRDVPQQQFSIADSWFLLGNILANVNDSEHPHDAKVGRDAYSNAIKLFADLHKQNPSDVTIHMRLAIALNNRGALSYHVKQLKVAESDYRAALVHRHNLAQQFPNAPQHQMLLAMVESNLAKLLLDSRRFTECRTTIDAGTKHITIAMKREPANPDYLALNKLLHETRVGLLQTIGPPPDTDATKARADYWIELGNAQFMAEQFRESVTAFQHSQNLGKIPPEVQLKLTLSLAKLRRIRDARATYARFQRWERTQSKLTEKIERLKHAAKMELARFPQCPADRRPVRARRPAIRGRVRSKN